MRATRGSMRRMAVVWGRLARKRWAGTTTSHLRSPLPAQVFRPYVTRLLVTAAIPCVTRLLAPAAHPYVTRLLSAAASQNTEGTSPIPGYEDVPELKSSSEEVQQIFDLEFSSQAELNKAAVKEMVRQLQIHPGDTGSAPVQIGVLTARIRYLTTHMQKNRKDKACLRGLLRLIHQRRSMLLYLKRRDFQRYHEILEELTIRTPTTLKYAQQRRK